ncbi:MAG TPA: FtsX-like permease family protein, partial [Gemmatimonadales bacterium]|nr:FtsX-like permease family protein [Gemmatimonadales bacterium]
ELVIRSALGATRARLIRQMLAETAGLALVGALGGVALTWFLVGALPGLLPDELALFSDAPVVVDHRVLLFGLGVTLVTWAACGIGPALFASRRKGSLSGGVSRGGTASAVGRRGRNALVVLQLALSLVLLAVTGLFLRSFVRLSMVDPGFDIRHVLTTDITIPSVRFQTGEQRSELVRRLADRLSTIPGIRRVSFTTGLPPRAGGISFTSRLETDAGTAGGGPREIPFSEVDTGFFATMGIPILRGRGFTDQDRGDSMAVAVINATMARTLWPGADPLGQRFRPDAGWKWYTVVGVAGEVKLMGPDDRGFPFAIYYPWSPGGRATRYLSLAILTTGSPEAYTGQVRQALHEVSPDLPILELVSGESRFAEGSEKPRFLLLLLGIFAGVAVTLALVGVYAVSAYAVLQRTREIGIRMALGADPDDVLRFFLGEGLLLAVGGAALGLIGFLATSRLVRSLLFDVGPRDPLVLAVAVAVLGLAVVLGVLVPARRASRVNPTVAMAPD